MTPCAAARARTKHSESSRGDRIRARSDGKPLTREQSLRLSVISTCPRAPLVANNWSTPQTGPLARRTPRRLLSLGPWGLASLSLSLWPHRSAFRRSTESSRATIFAGAPSGATHARAHRTTSLPNRSFSTITTITTVSKTIKAIFTVLFPHTLITISQPQKHGFYAANNCHAGRARGLQQKLFSEPCGVEDTYGAALHVQQSAGSAPITIKSAQNRKNTFQKSGQYTLLGQR